MLRVVGRVDQRGLDLGEVGDGGVRGVPGERHPLVQVPVWFRGDGFRLTMTEAVGWQGQEICRVTCITPLLERGRLPGAVKAV